MNKNHGTEGDRQVPYVDFPYDEVRMADDNSDEKIAILQAKLDKLVNERVEEATLRTIEWLSYPVVGARMRPEKMILAKTHVLLLNLCPGATLTEVANNIQMPKQKLTIINDDYCDHFGLQSPVRKSGDARAAQARRFANLPQVGGMHPQLDLISGKPIED
jgi:hypothetical protein